MRNVPMTSFLEAMLVGGAIGIVPLLLGFVPSFLIGDRWRGWPSFSAGMALGFLSLFFTDLLDDSGGLGESLGLAFTPTQITLVALFFLGFAVLTVAARRHGGLAGGTVLLAYLVAVGIGIHAMGEGMIIGNNLAGQVEIEDLSTLTQGLSFAMHKFLEGFTIAVFFTRKDAAKASGICLVLAGVPMILGVPLGFFTYPAILANFLFAAGAGAVLFVIVKVARSVDYEKHLWEFISAFLVGFILVYVGTLIHFAEAAGS
jgi:zinc transporter ZupT